MNCALFCLLLSSLPPQSLLTMQLIIKFVCAAYSRFHIILFLFKSVNRRQIHTTIRAQADAIHNAKYLSYAGMHFFLWGIRFALSLPQSGNAYCLSAKAQRPSTGWCALRSVSHSLMFLSGIISALSLWGRGVQFMPLWSPHFCHIP